MAMVSGAGLLADQVHDATTAAEDVIRAYSRALRERRPVLLMISSALSRLATSADLNLPDIPMAPAKAQPSEQAILDACALLATAERPAILAGLGAVNADAGDDLIALGADLDAVLATSLRANGLFADHPFYVGISGGFATPLAVELLAQADVVLVCGASMNDWTTRAGSMFPNARIIQIDDQPSAFGKHHKVDVAIHADVAVSVQAITRQLRATTAPKTGHCTEALAAKLKGSLALPTGDLERADGKIDPRTLTRLIDEMIPRKRNVVTDGGGFLNHSVKLRPSDARGFVIPIIYMALGTGLPAAIGTSIARPDRITLAAVGDAGALMALADLETMARVGGPILLVIYNDSAHGGEVEYYRPKYPELDLLEFEDFDFAAVARAAGMDAMTVREPSDLEKLRDWVKNPGGPMVVDAKIGALPPSDELFSGDSAWSLRLLHSQGF
jgi:thiamine pyrophosphate-dependent acetolactate synthase large subunit-like protein